MIRIKIARTWLTVLISLVIIGSCRSQEICCPEELELGTILTGKASFYGVKFHGKMTANGEKMDRKALTCAHPGLPFGTMLEVTNLDNGERVIVRVNDRGPFSRDRILDISFAAAEKIKMVRKGIQRVSVMTVGCCGEVYLQHKEQPSVEAADVTTGSVQRNYE